MKALLLPLLLVSACAQAGPSCADPDAKNIVLATTGDWLADGSGGQLLLQNVATSDRILMRPCSGVLGNRCYFAVNVAPGKYYFSEVLPSAKNSLVYPVSGKGLWFEVTGKGVDYIGDWTVTRTDQREVKRLAIKYVLKDLDKMLKTCEITGKPQFLDKTREAAQEIVD